MSNSGENVNAGEDGETVKLPCVRCSNKTTHRIVSSLDAQGGDEDGFYQWHCAYQIVQCQGCDDVSFRSACSNSEDIDPETGEHFETENLYPNRIEGRKPLADAYLIPHELQRIYTETLAALSGKLPVLAGIGIRAIVEVVCRERKATGGTLFERINSLVSLGVLTNDGAEILHKLRVLGNDAAHEVKAHSDVELALAMNVIEHLLQAVYILPRHAKATFK